MDKTSLDQHCATSSGPRSPAAMVANALPSTRRTPADTGSTPSRAHARSTNDSAGTIVTDTRGSARQELDRPLGDERRTGHRIDDRARAVRLRVGSLGNHLLDDRRVHLVEGAQLVIERVERAHRPPRRERLHRGVPPSSQQHRPGRQSVEHSGREVVGAGWSEPDHGQRRPSRPESTAQPEALALDCAAFVDVVVDPGTFAVGLSNAVLGGLVAATSPIAPLVDSQPP